MFPPVRSVPPSEQTKPMLIYRCYYRVWWLIFLSIGHREAIVLFGRTIRCGVMEKLVLHFEPKQKHKQNFFFIKKSNLPLKKTTLYLRRYQWRAHGSIRLCHTATRTTVFFRRIYTEFADYWLEWRCRQKTWCSHKRLLYYSSSPCL